MDTICATKNGEDQYVLILTAHQLAELVKTHNRMVHRRLASRRKLNDQPEYNVVVGRTCDFILSLPDDFVKPGRIVNTNVQLKIENTPTIRKRGPNKPK